MQTGEGRGRSRKRGAFPQPSLRWREAAVGTSFLLARAAMAGLAALSIKTRKAAVIARVPVAALLFLARCLPGGSLDGEAEFCS